MRAPSIAESLYCEFLVGGTPATGIDELCELHPELAADLRLCDERHRLATDALRAGGVEARDPAFAQRYVELGEIGRGGMGAVFDVDDRRLGRRAALKRALSGNAVGVLALVQRERARARIVHEARLLAQLAEPGIVPVHDVGIDADGIPYFTMKRVHGCPLQELISRHHSGDTNWTLVRMIGVLHRAALTLAAAHRRGVVHRDVKPENIMVGDEGQVYVLDWGIAATERTENAPAEHVSVAGTPSYMAPEQAAGRQAGRHASVDVHALGAVLYHLLAGRRPYAELGDAGALTQLAYVRKQPPQRLSQLAPHAPDVLVAIAEHAMAADPLQRYPDMSALAADLRAFLELRPVAIQPRGGLAELRWWARRHVVPAASLAVTVVLVIVATGLWLIIQANTASQLYASSQRQAAITSSAQQQETAALANQRAALLPADRRRLDQLCKEQDRLGPAVPANAHRMADWLTRADALIARRAEHEQALASVRARAEGVDPQLAARLAVLDDSVVRAIASRDAAFDGWMQDPDDQTRQADVVRTCREVAAARSAREEAPTWQFATASDRWLHGALVDLLARLRELPKRIAMERVHLAHAESIQRRSIDSPEAAAAWSIAIGAIAVLPAYGGLRLRPQLGLVPLGPDPVSRLWEFAHLQTGRPAVRDPDGKLVVAQDTGLVLVLTPGDHTGAIPPMFVSKYEMTQAHWLRATGNNPSVLSPDNVELHQRVTLLHPVGMLSLAVAHPALARLHLEVPDDALWLHVARAGSNARWVFGDDLEALREFANCADVATRRGWKGRVLTCAAYDDGYVTTSPVGSFGANRFGLHDVIGNATELTRNPTDHGVERVRGAGALYGAADMPVDWFQELKPDNAWITYGVRPVRRIDE